MIWDPILQNMILHSVCKCVGLPAACVFDIPGGIDVFDFPRLDVIFLGQINTIKYIGQKPGILSKC
jgi:hypothetical protein